MTQFYILDAPSIQIEGGPALGTRYALDQACPHCGTGARAIGDRIVDAIPDGFAAIFFTNDHDLIVDEALALALHGIGVHSLARVLDLQSQVLPFFELRAQTTLPPFSKRTTGYEIEDQCLTCLRDGFFNVPREDFKLVYENLDSTFLEYNVLSTYECFGTSSLKSPFSESVFASPKLIVSDHVNALLTSRSMGYGPNQSVRFESLKIK